MCLCFFFQPSSRVSERSSSVPLLEALCWLPVNSQFQQGQTGFTGRRTGLKTFWFIVNKRVNKQHLKSTGTELQSLLLSLDRGTSPLNFTVLQPQTTRSRSGSWLPSKTDVSAAATQHCRFQVRKISSYVQIEYVSLRLFIQLWLWCSCFWHEVFVLMCSECLWCVNSVHLCHSFLQRYKPDHWHSRHCDLHSAWRIPWIQRVMVGSKHDRWWICGPAWIQTDPREGRKGWNLHCQELRQCEGAGVGDLPHHQPSLQPKHQHHHKDRQRWCWWVQRISKPQYLSEWECWWRRG